jgi:hypothetical protein
MVKLTAITLENHYCIGNREPQKSNPLKTPSVPKSIRECEGHMPHHYRDKGDIIGIAEQSERRAISGPLLDVAAARVR